MTNKHKRARLFLAASAIAISTSAMAGETVNYAYDELGRLTATSSSGTVNNGIATSTAYDPAGNRSNYSVTGAGGGSPPPPPSPNDPPAANADYLSLTEWQSALINVVANDSDPNGDYPLTVTAISDASGAAYLASGSDVGWSGAPAGNYAVQYTIRDSRGATATGTLNVSVSGPDPGCGTVRGTVCE